MRSPPSDGDGLRPGSGSIENPDYWWYVARSRLLEVVFGGLLNSRGRLLDIGSADGPSVDWLDQRMRRVATDRDPSGLVPGDICADGLQLPFKTGSFDVVSAFDVIEHFADDARLLHEIRRVLKPDGRLILSVPAYQWAWSDFDESAGHFRRYTKRSMQRLLERNGFVVERATYAFMGTFLPFLMDRLTARVLSRQGERVSDSELPRVVSWLLLKMSSLDARLLAEHDLPFGSSVLAAARSSR